MNARDRAFVKLVWDHYKQFGRHTLPWRNTRHPYRILVSEIMLQQTQVDRVIPKYKSFLKQFPTIRSLSSAPFGAVLRAWHGLGYNRRAKMLHECARTICEKHLGRVPKEYAILCTLPGIGPYTAAALSAFAYNIPMALIETNVRSAYLYHFYADRTDVEDHDIRLCIERTLDRTDPRTWYWALMDYGAHIKKTHGNQNSRSRHYVRQSAFQGSDRQIRGAILRALFECTASRTQLHQALPFEYDRIDAQLMRLSEEGLITTRRGRYTLPE